MSFIGRQPSNAILNNDDIVDDSISGDKISGGAAEVTSLSLNGNDLSSLINDRMQVANTVLLVNDRMQVANVTSAISTAISNLVDSAPTTLDTLNELAAALGDDANFSTTVTTNLGQKLGATATVALTGDVTASATAFSSNSVSLSTSLATSSGSTLANYVQVANAESNYATSAQGSTADSAMQDLVDDSTPQLGGNLDGQSYNISTTGSLTAGGLSVNGVATLNGLSSDLVLQGITSGSQDGNEIKWRTTTSSGYDLAKIKSVTGTNFYDGNLVIQTQKAGYAGDLADRILIANSGDIDFYDSAGTTAKFHWDAADERLGIGTSSPTYALDVESNNSGGLVASFVNTATSIPQGVLIEFPNATPNATNRYFLKMEDSTSVKAEINSTGGGYFMGNVGIGDSDPSEKLNVAGNIMLEGEDQYMYLSNIGIGNAGIYVRGIGTSNTLRSHSTGDFKWEITGSQKMMLDSSANLHVACESHQASASSGTGGYTLGSLGVSARNGDVAHYFNRIGTDGRIVEFRKNGSIMGGIGSDETQPDGTENTTTATLYIGAGDAGLGFTDDGDFIYPYDFDSRTPSHNVITLGHSSKKFKDGHFAGTLYAARGVGNTNTGTPSSAPTPSFDTDSNWVWTLTSNITLQNSSDHIVGQSGFFVFRQDATGGRTVSLGSYYKTSGGAGLTLSSAANAIDMVPYVVISSTEILLGTPQLAFA
jgi:hypothetical protein